MLDHKIDNTDNKESKTECSNQEEGGMILAQEDDCPSASEDTLDSFPTDPLESHMVDYLVLKNSTEQQNQMSPLNSKWHGKRN
jgi:hypothetical protein